MHKGGGCRWSKRTSDSAELMQLIEAVATQEVTLRSARYVFDQTGGSQCNSNECRKDNLKSTLLQKFSPINFQTFNNVVLNEQGTISVGQGDQKIKDWEFSITRFISDA